MAQAIMLDNEYALDAPLAGNGSESDYDRWFCAKAQEGLADLESGNILDYEEVRKIAAQRRAELLANANAGR